MVVGVDAEPQRGSWITDADRELRITARCLAEDLAVTPEADIADVAGHPIVEALVAKRAAQPDGGDTVGPTAGAATLYTLRGAGRYRGATWFDGEEDVVWLCAAGFHSSGKADDAFRHFERLRDDGRIAPSANDYLRLRGDRRTRFDDLADRHAVLAIQASLHSPGTPIDARLGRVLPARVMADAGPLVLSIELALEAAGLSMARIEVALRAFSGDDDPLWENDALSWARPDELGFRLLRQPS